MNQLNQVMNQYRKTDKKLFVMRMEQSIFQTAKPDELVPILKEGGFGAISLICTDRLEECLKLAESLTVPWKLPVILETDFHWILKMGIADFAKAAAQAGVSGIRVPDLPFEEQGQLAVYLLEEEGPFLIREITPASGDRIIQNMQFARGFIWCDREGNVQFLSELQGDPYVFYLYAVEAAATLPILLEFNSRCLGDLENYLNSADGAIVGNDLMDRFHKEGYSSKALREYCSRFQG